MTFDNQLERQVLTTHHRTMCYDDSHDDHPDRGLHKNNNDISTFTLRSILASVLLLQGPVTHEAYAFWENLDLGLDLDWDFESGFGNVDLVSLVIQYAIQLKEFIHTLFLFTYTDYKTILFPISVFASVAAPVTSWHNFALGLLWTWLHLLQCNLSNQYKTIDEDRLNRPWRPLPAGRISPKDAAFLRVLVVPICLAVSAWLGGSGGSVGGGWLSGKGVVLASAGLTATTIVYDECGWAGHWVGKNAAAVWGYGTFEVGATLIMGTSKELSTAAFQSILISISVIFTTIHAQDCPDVEGDTALGRITFPIYAPTASRLVLLLLLPFWSLFNAFHWGLVSLSGGDAGVFGLLYVALGVYVGVRYWVLREQKDDARSYLVYNVWLLTTHFLPIMQVLQ